MTQKDWYEAAGQQFYQKLQEVEAQRDETIAMLLEACEAALQTFRDDPMKHSSVETLLEKAIAKAKKGEAVTAPIEDWER